MNTFCEHIRISLQKYRGMKRQFVGSFQWCLHQPLFLKNGRNYKY